MVDYLSSTPGTYTVYATIDSGALDYATHGKSSTITVVVSYGYITDANIYVSYGGTYAGTDDTLPIPYAGSDLIPSIETQVYGSANDDGSASTLLTAGTDYTITYTNSDNETVDSIMDVRTYYEAITSDKYTLLDADGDPTDSVVITIYVTAADIYGIQASGLVAYDGYSWGENTTICTPYTKEAISPQIQFATTCTTSSVTDGDDTEEIATP